MRTKELQSFLDHHSGKLSDPYPRDEEVPATTQEVGWIKWLQVKRALRHKGAGVATRADLLLLDDHTDVDIDEGDYLNSGKLERLADIANIEKYFG